MSKEYYKIEEYRSTEGVDSWVVTDQLLDMGAVHYFTHMYGDYIIRNFFINITEEELVIIKLKFGNVLEIHLLSEIEILKLTSQGYIK